MLSVSLSMGHNYISKNLIETIYIWSETHVAALHISCMKESHNIQCESWAIIFKKIVFIADIFGDKRSCIALSIRLSIHGRGIGSEVSIFYGFIHRADNPPHCLPQGSEVTDSGNLCHHPAFFLVVKFLPKIDCAVGGTCKSLFYRASLLQVTDKRSVVIAKVWQHKRSTEQIVGSTFPFRKHFNISLLTRVEYKSVKILTRLADCISQLCGRHIFVVIIECRTRFSGGRILIFIWNKRFTVSANYKQIMAVGVFLYRPADKIRQFLGVGNGKILTGIECRVFGQNAILRGVTVRTVVRFAFSFTGVFMQYRNGNVVIRYCCCLPGTLH